MDFCDIQSECMKKLTYGKALFLIIGILILPSFVRADDFTLSGYTEVGKRSTAEDYEEEGTDDDYAYQNYHLKLERMGTVLFFEKIKCGH